MPNSSIDANNPLNTPVRLQIKRVRPRGIKRSKLPVLRNIRIRGDNNIGPSPKINAAAIPNLIENLFISLKSAPVDLPVTASLVTAPLKIFNGLDNAIIRAYR